jgi:RimJ/RimL family protein N-acetyltransferase
MISVLLRAPDPADDFGWIAALINSVDVEPTGVNELTEWYQHKLPDDIHLRVAENASGERLGFHCLYRYNAGDGLRYKFYLIVEPEYQRQGAGTALYDHLEGLARSTGFSAITTNILDNDPSSRRFAEKRGFIQKSHDIQMVLDLAVFNNKSQTDYISALKSKGFHFTTMAEVGNGEEAQRKLYALNNSVSATQPGHDGVSAWGSFEDFQRTVCQMGWYKPAGQFVVIDSSTGDWAAMSAITRFENADHAYNLFTGVDPRYRGRKLGQAVKSLALCYARDQLGVDKVRTNHDADNAPMIAIDRQLGYVQVPGTCRMEKTLKGKE